MVRLNNEADTCKDNNYLKIFLGSGLPFIERGINVYNKQKRNKMKIVKLSVFALTLGLFAASCGNSGSEATTEAPATEATTEAPAAEATPAPEAAPATTDSAAAATTPAPAAEAAPAPAAH